MLPAIFTEKASKTIVSCDASSKFHRTSCQKDRFVRGSLQFSENKLPKRAFRTMLPTIFTEKVSKIIVSCDASSKFNRTSFQNERFMRGFLQISQNNASKTIVSFDASSKFHRTSFQNERFARCFRQFSQKKFPKRAFRTMLPTISIENLRFATVSCHRPTESYERVHPAKARCASRYKGVPFHISKSTFYYSGVRKNV